MKTNACTSAIIYAGSASPADPSRAHVLAVDCQTGRSDERRRTADQSRWVESDRLTWPAPAKRLNRHALSVSLSPYRRWRSLVTFLWPQPPARLPRLVPVGCPGRSDDQYRKPDRQPRQRQQDTRVWLSGAHVLNDERQATDRRTNHLAALTCTSCASTAARLTELCWPD